MSYRVLVVGNNKGGVGKTFVAKSLAEYMAILHGMRVLAIDLDPQTNLSRRYLEMQVLSGSNDYGPPIHPDYDALSDEDWDGYSDAADIWLKGGAVPYPTNYTGLEIIPAHATKLQDLEYIKRKDLYEAVIQQLQMFVYHQDVTSNYDITVLDTQPSKGPLVQAAMHAASHVLIPTQLEAPAVEGLQGMLSQRRLVNRDRPSTDQLKLVGVLPNLVRNIRLHDEYRALLTDEEFLGSAVLPVQLNDWAEYRESMLHGVPSLFRTKKSGRLREQLELACSTVLSRIKEN